MAPERESFEHPSGVQDPWLHVRGDLAASQRAMALPDVAALGSTASLMRTAIAIAVCVGAASGGRSAAGGEPPFVAECILARPGLAELDLLLHPGRDKRASEQLVREHAQEHGWSWNFRDPDWIEPERGASCPAEVLDVFERAGTPPNVGSTEWSHLIALAEALGRNGRVEQALELLLLNTAAAQVDESHLGFFKSFLPSVYAETGTRIAAHSGQWERALELSVDWTPTSTCGNCGLSELRRIVGLRARCWVELGRCDHVREEALKSLARQGNPELVEMWIECQIREGPARPAVQALDAILAQVPAESWPSCQEGYRRWQLAHMLESELGPHLSELAAVARERAVLLIRTLDQALVLDRLSAFDRVGEDLRDPSLAWALVESGRPEVEAVFGTDPEGLGQRPPGEVDEDRFVKQLEQMHRKWQQADEQWRCLTSRR